MASTAATDGIMAETRDGLGLAVAPVPSAGQTGRFPPRRDGVVFEPAVRPDHEWLGSRLRSTIWPSSSATTAFTDVVPTSTPAVSGRGRDWIGTQPDMLGQYCKGAPPHKFFVCAAQGSGDGAVRGPGFDKLARLAQVVLRTLDRPGPAPYLRRPGAGQATYRPRARTSLVVEADFVDATVFELPLIAVAATRGDPNNVDVGAATAAGVPVIRTPGRNADAVAELAIGCSSRSPAGSCPPTGMSGKLEVFRDGTIPYQRFRGWEVAGRRAAIIGYGAVGRALEWRLRGLGMDVVVYDPYVEGAGNETWSRRYASVDVVSVHAALTPESVGCSAQRTFSWMRPGAVFLNTARAQLHDMGALVGALESGHLGGAGLDHFDGEMLPAGHALLSMDNVVLTPHIGGATTDTEARGAQMVADDLELLLAGETPLNVVNPEVLGRSGMSTQS